MMSRHATPFQPPDPRIKIRPVLRGDVVPLHQRCMGDVRALESVRRLVERAGRLALYNAGQGIVAYDADGAYAYGQVMLWTRCAEISDLVVSETRRGQGVGTALIQQLCRAAGDLGARCVEIGAAHDNARALSLYRRLGFEDAFTVQLMLDGALTDVIYLRLSL